MFTIFHNFSINYSPVTFIVVNSFSHYMYVVKGICDFQLFTIIITKYYKVYV